MQCDMCCGTMKFVGLEGAVKKYRCPFCLNEKDEVDAVALTILKTEADARARAQSDDAIKSKVDAAIAASATNFSNATCNSGETVFEKTRDAVVEIRTNESSGSGFIIERVEGYIVTNTHVIYDEETGFAKTVNVIFANNTSLPAQIINSGVMNGYDDLAILKVNSHSMLKKAVTLGDSSLLKNGQQIYIIGNSLGQGICITSGIISDKERTTHVQRGHLIMSDCATNPGNSGGPVFNADGKVIGIHVQAERDAVGMKYHIPVNRLKEFIKETESKIGRKIL